MTDIYIIKTDYSNNVGIGHPPKPLCEDCKIHISKESLGNMMSKAIIKDCPNFHSYRLIDGEYRISIKEKNKVKELLPEQIINME